MEGAGSEVSKIPWLRYCFLQLSECFCVLVLTVQGNAKSPSGQRIPVEYVGLALDIVKDASLRFCKLWEVALKDISNRASRIVVGIELWCE